MGCLIAIGGMNIALNQVFRMTELRLSEMYWFKLEHNKPDIVVVNKETNACLIIDVACPFDTRVIEKEREKITRYEDLKWEIIKIWKCGSVRVIPIVIGALGTISKGFKDYLSEISEDIYFGTLQKACLLGTARTLRYALSIWGCRMQLDALKNKDQLKNLRCDSSQ